MIKRLPMFALALAMAACASPKTATIEDGKVANISSSEAVTLVKQDVRRQKVADVQKNAKPLLKIEAYDGQPITINAKSFEVNAPQDIRELLAEQADSVSENVQIVREVRGIARETVAPLGLGSIMLNDRNNARSSAERINESNNARAAAADAADAARDQAVIDALQAKPDYFVLPAGAVPAASPAE